MKKVRITVNPGSEGRTFYVFGSPEGAYIWLTEAYSDPEIIEKIPDVEHVSLYPGEFIEAELRGYEYAYDGQNHSRVDLVRFAKAHELQNASELMTSIHYGWTVDYIIPFRSYKDDDITVCVLGDEDVHKVDLGSLFKDDEENK